ncbi:MAG TPA: sodium:calcium antiporter [Candidatus Gracilibacteria bacterium]
MPLILSVLLFCISTFVLVRGADTFVENADKIGKAMRLPSFLTGVLVVAIGTSLPELATGVASLLNEKATSDMMVGTVLGSNVANVFLGLGAVIVLSRKNLKFKQNIFQVHFPILMTSTIAVIFMSLDHQITAQEGGILWGIMVSYLWFLFKTEATPFGEKIHHEVFRWKYVLFLIIGLLALVGGANFVVESILDLGTYLIIQLGVSSEILTALSATLTAIGTSLPEMVVVYVSMRKGNAEMAVGNILGSNIFNILLILGVGSLISPLAVDGINYTVVLPFSVASFFVYWTVSKDQEITQQESLAMVFLYILFLGKLYGWM